MHAFDSALELTALEPTPLDQGRFRGRTTTAYANMVGPFGGVTAAALVRAVELHPDRVGDPVSITVNFAGPIADGEFEVSARPVRVNRSNQHWYLELSQEGVVATTATAVFGSRRETWDEIESRPPAVPAPSELPRSGFPDIIAWSRNYEMRFAAGAMDANPAADSEITLWVRDDPPRPWDAASITSISDVFYPRVFQRLGTMIAAGTISLTVHYFATADDELAALGDGYLLATAQARRFHRGYFDQSAEIWTPDGTLLATGHQIVYYKN